MTAQPQRTPQLSLIAPAHNEEDNVAPLVREVDETLRGAEIDYEFIVVDDGSTDATLPRLAQMLGRYPRLRVIRLSKTPKGRGNGQSAAFHAGIRAARAPVLAMIDADCQNDPADIPRLLAQMEAGGADLVQGDRSHARKDSLMRRVTSVVSRWFRVLLFRDSIRDTACSLRVIRREVALQLLLQFRGQHRYIPMIARHLGYRVVEAPVNHRPRNAGRAKYGLFNRAIPAIGDVLAVRWMMRRRRSCEFEEIEAAENASAPARETAHAGADQFVP
jgi:dolichol-phosphate mannosyltransferase